MLGLAKLVNKSGKTDVCYYIGKVIKQVFHVLWGQHAVDDSVLYRQKAWAQLFKTNNVVSLRFVKISNVYI